MKKLMEYFEYKDNFAKHSTVSSELLFYQNKKEVPIITIAIPAYKRVLMMLEAVKSIAVQATDVIEIIIVDDNEEGVGLPPEFTEFVINYPLISIAYYKNKKRIGMMANWNRCIELSRGKWVSILHDDDLLMDNYISKAMETINKLSVEAIFFNFDMVGSKFNKNVKEKSSLIQNLKKGVKNLQKEVKLLPPSKFYYDFGSWGTLGTLFLKKHAIELGGFNDDYYPISDYVFFSYYVYKFKKAYINRNVCCQMRWEVNTSLSLETITKTRDELRVFMKYLSSIYRIPHIFNKVYCRGKIYRNAKKSAAITGISIHEILPKITLADKLSKIPVSFIIAILIFLYGRK